MRGHHCGKEEKVLLWQNFPGLFAYLPQELKKNFPSDDILMETIEKTNSDQLNKKQDIYVKKKNTISIYYGIQGRLNHQDIEWVINQQY